MSKKRRKSGQKSGPVNHSQNNKNQNTGGNVQAVQQETEDMAVMNGQNAEDVQEAAYAQNPGDAQGAAYEQNMGGAQEAVYGQNTSDVQTAEAAQSAVAERPLDSVLKEHSFYVPQPAEGSGSDWDDEEDYDEDEEEVNREGVNRMKKAIIIALIVMFLIPTILCLILLMHMHSMQNEMDQLRKDVLGRKEQMLLEQQAKEKEENTVLLDKEASAKIEKDRAGVTVLHKSGQDAGKETAGKDNSGKETAGKDNSGKETVGGETTEEASGEQGADQETVREEDVEEGKRVYLTFDDGPSKNASKILDVLKEKNVKATFFMVLNDKSNQAVIKRMAEEGHTLGIHSASHVYSEVYADLDSFRTDVNTVHDLLYEMTGQDVRFYRFPGGSSNRVSDVPIEDCIAYLEESGYKYFDWNASNGDSSGAGYTPEQLEENVLRYVRNNTGDSIVLMHDLEGCPETAESLSHLIDTLREEGYTLLPISEKTKTIHHRRTAKEEEEEIAAQKKALEEASEDEEQDDSSDGDDSYN